MVDTEEQFPPRPGGMVASARQQQAAQQAAAPAGVEEPLAGGYPAVRVDDVPPETGATKTVVVAIGGVATERLLGANPSRRRAVVLAVDQAVVLTTSRGAADNPLNAVTAAGLPAGGFVLPAGIPIVLWGTCEWFVTAMSATAGRVSAISEARAPA